MIHQSSLKYWESCKYAYKLSLEEKIEQTDAMREGLLFEGYVFGFKNNDEDELIGRKKENTINAIKREAQLVKGFFAGEGSAFHKLEYEDLQGEADWLGDFVWDGETIEVIADLKRTSDISRYWNTKYTRMDFLQSIVYPYIYYKTKKKILPFIYVIFQEPVLIKLIRVNPTLEDFDWLENLLKDVREEIFFSPDKNYCPNCPFKNVCEYYLTNLLQTIEINFKENYE